MAKAKKISRIDVPWRGNQMLAYVAPYMTDVEWKPNDVFEAEMTCTGMSRGRSSLRLELRDELGREYLLFAQAIEAFVARATKGRLRGRWQAAKQGTDYGLLLLDDEQETAASGS